MRFVLDTNVLISAVLKPQSIPSKVLSHAQWVGQLVFSSATLAELEEVLSRPKFEKYLRNNTPHQVLETITGSASIMTDIDEPDFQCRDRKDVKFLQIAHAAHVSCLVSGDTDLLVLHPFQGIPILSPSDFLNTF